MKKNRSAGSRLKAPPGEIAAGAENTASGLFDGPDYEDPEIAELLAGDEPGPESEEGIFDEIVLEAERTGGREYVPAEDPTANPYRDVFLTPDEDERPLEEIIRDVGSLELGADDLGGEAAALAKKVKEKVAAGEGHRVNYWYYYHNGTQAGPLAEPELKALLASGNLPLDTYVWREGFAGWVAAAQTDLAAGEGGPASSPKQEQVPKSPSSPGTEAGMPS